jgi:GT2 family glycosyltransferase
MRQMLKNMIRYTIRGTKSGAKKVLGKNPRLKETIKQVLFTQLGLPLVSHQVYQLWLQRNIPDFIEITRLREEAASFAYQPLISVLVPTYNTDPGFLRDCLNSVRAQVYDKWELCIVDDGSPNDTVRSIIKEYAAKDSRIRYTFLEQNQHIARATNEAIALATGEFVALLDHDDLLWPNALYEVVKALNEDRGLDFLYTDEDKITEDRFEHLAPFFKPDWNPDFLRSVNYMAHFAVIRKEIVERIDGFREGYEGAQDWDLFLRITRVTQKIHHIPKIVYSWRVHRLSTAKGTQAKPYAVEAQRKALTDDLCLRHYEDARIEIDKKHTGYWQMTYPVRGEPLISIVIPSKNHYKVVRRCINSIYKKTTYSNFEIVLVDTGSSEKRVLRWYQKLQQQHANFTLVHWPEQPFSYSRVCNKGAEVAKGSLLVMLNNDTEVITPNWLELMAGDALRNEIGAVGCLLFYPDGRHIQHAGVGVGLGGLAANSFSLMTLMQEMTQTQHLMLNTKHNMTAVTAACMMIRKDLFFEVGGFSEEFRVTYNDVDLCLRLYEKGYQNLYTPYVRLLHHESLSLGSPEEKKRDTKEIRTAQQLFRERWARYVAHDPNLNQNLTKENALYDLPRKIAQTS